MPVARPRRPPTRACTRRTAGARTRAKNPAMKIQAMTSTLSRTIWMTMYVASTTPTEAAIVRQGTSLQRRSRSASVAVVSVGAPPMINRRSGPGGPGGSGMGPC